MQRVPGGRSAALKIVLCAVLAAGMAANTAAALIASAEPRHMRLQLLRDVDSKGQNDALQDGLRDNTPKEELAALKAPADRLPQWMAEIGDKPVQTSLKKSLLGN